MESIYSENLPKLDLITSSSANGAIANGVKTSYVPCLAAMEYTPLPDCWFTQCFIGAGMEFT